MTQYLYSNNLKKYIEVYVQKVSPQKTPQVVGKLLDLDSNEDFVRGLLQSVGLACPVEELVEQVSIIYLRVLVSRMTRGSWRHFNDVNALLKSERPDLSLVQEEAISSTLWS